MDQKIKKNTVCGFEFPRLTKEERVFFEKWDREYPRKYKKYGYTRKLYLSKRPICERIASSLHNLAVNKMGGFFGFKKNKGEAVKHHLKACRYNPVVACGFPIFRKASGLRVPKPCYGVFRSC